MSPGLYPAASKADTAVFHVVSSADQPWTNTTGVRPDGVPLGRMVWQALTTGEGIARWFAPHAAVTPGEGGSVSVGWDPKEMWDQPITVWEPLRRIQTASEMPSADGRVVRLAVDYYLEAHGGMVRV